MLVSTLSIAAFPAEAALSECTDGADVSTAHLHIVQAAHRSELWQEDNRLAGLQREACHDQGYIYEGDAFVAQVVPDDLGMFGLCVQKYLSQCL